MYIGSVAALSLALLVLSWARYGLDLGLDFAVFVALALALVVGDNAVVEGRTRVSLWSILILACQAVLGPAGAGVLGVLMGMLQGRALPLRVRLFNSAQASAVGSLGGLAFLAVGGSLAKDVQDGLAPVLGGLGAPMLVADLVQIVGNLVLLAGVVWVSGNGSVRGVIQPLFGTLPSFVGFGVIAFVLVVLWDVAHVGPAAALLVLAPLLVAQWAFRQHAEELRGQDRALQVLVAALEAKAPHLGGHSGRVSALSAAVAEDLGLAPGTVADVRMAGMLHDVGQTSLPTPLVHEAFGDTALIPDYPTRGVGILTGLGFLQGALAPIGEHRAALEDTAAPGASPARIVGLVDAFDLLTEVGDPVLGPLSRDDAMARLETLPGVDARLLSALRSALARRAVGSAG